MKILVPPMNWLISAGRQSMCKKSQRGAVLLTQSGLVAAYGFNQPAVGECDDSPACRRDCAVTCVHAEQAALLGAGTGSCGCDMFHLKVVGGEPTTSGHPSCAECSKLMLQAGVAGVWLYQDTGWKRWSAEQFHRETLAMLGFGRSA